VFSSLIMNVVLKPGTCTNEPAPCLMLIACHHQHHVESTCTSRSWQLWAYVHVHKKCGEIWMHGPCLLCAHVGTECSAALLCVCIPALSRGTDFSPFDCREPKKSLL